MNRSTQRWAAYQAEAQAAREAFVRDDLVAAFNRLERAHILGQPWAGPHTWTHWMMLRIGWRRRDAREVVGQLVRLAAGGVLSWVGLLPVGNTGGANIPATKSLPLPDDLRPLVETFGRRRRSGAPRAQQDDGRAG
jgi:hypothetical protein